MAPSAAARAHVPNEAAASPTLELPRLVRTPLASAGARAAPLAPPLGGGVRGEGARGAPSPFSPLDGYGFMHEHGSSSLTGACGQGAAMQYGGS